ncbi:MAG: hypothetical protein J5676_03870 [Bacteroidaceae bacterium]|nr:hypothetical protein [Bacteroidaceae bacterium]
MEKERGSYGVGSGKVRSRYVQGSFNLRSSYEEDSGKQADNNSQGTIDNGQIF